MQHLEQRLRDFRKVVIESPLHACREEREAFKQSLDVRIFGLARLELQARRHLRVLLGKLGAKLAQVRQFALVIEQQVVLHQGALAMS